MWRSYLRAVLLAALIVTLVFIAFYGTFFLIDVLKSATGFWYVDATPGMVVSGWL